MTKELATLVQTAIDIINNENERLREKISELEGINKRAVDLESTVKALRKQVKIYEDKIDLISSDKVKAYDTMIEVIKGNEVMDLDKQIELLQIMVGFK